METLVNVIKEFFHDLRRTLKNVENIIGKSVIDSEACIKGVVIDVIKNMLGQKVSILGVNYSQDENEIIEAFNEDVIVVQGKERVFIPESDISAIGSVILLKRKIELPEIDEKSIEKFQKKVRERLKKILQMFELESKFREILKK